VTFSYSLVLALFLLAPGFAFVAAIYAASGRNRMEAAPPPPNSIMALAIVTGGALAAHSLTALFFALCHLAAWLFKASWSLAEPDPYVLSLHLGALPPADAALGLAWILAVLTVVCALTFLITRRLIHGTASNWPALNAALYGWLHEIREDDGALAYVVTHLTLDGAAIGYEGVVDYVVLDSEKQILSLVLIDAQTFTLVAKGGIVHRVPNPRDVKMERLVLTKSEIRNIAFDPIKLAPSDELSPQ
jgi:hypothetical protein